MKTVQTLSKRTVIRGRLDAGETARQIADATGYDIRLCCQYATAWRKERGLTRPNNRVNGPLPVRFEAKVDRSGGPDACHIWIAGKMKEGYGCFQDRKGELGPPQQHRAHRVAWILAYGWIDSDVLLLHSCDNPACVNVRHLRIGTQLENMHDALDRGRHKANRSPITVEVAREIRRRTAAGEKAVHIATSLGLPREPVWCVASGRTFKRVG